MVARETFPDLHLKMSKKIAQLTKVIYHLNTKNEDNESQIKVLNEHHECEISEILNDAAAKINKFKEKLTERREISASHEAIEALKKQHENEKQVALRDIKEFKRRTSQKESKIKSDFERRIADLHTELEISKESFDERVKKFSDLFEKYKKNSSSTSKQVEKLKKEISDVVQAGNEKYNSMLSQRMDIEDKLKKSLKEKEKAFEAKLREEKKRFEDQLKEAKRQADEGKLEELRAQQKLNAQELCNSKETMSQKIEILKKELDMKENQFNDLNQKHELKCQESKKHEGTISMLENTIKEEQERFRKTQSQAKDVSGEFDDAKRRFADRIHDLEAEKSKLEQLLAESKCKMDEYLKQHSILESDFKRIETELKQHKNDSSKLEASLKETIKEKNEILEELKCAFDKCKAEIKRLKESHEYSKKASSKETSSLKEDLEKTSDDLFKAKKRVSELEKSLEDLRKAKTNVENQFQNKHQGLTEQLETLKNEHKSEMIKMTEKNEKQIKAILSEKDEESSRLIETHKNDMEKMKAAHISKVKKLEDDMDKLKQKHSLESQEKAKASKLVNDLKSSVERTKASLSEKIKAYQAVEENLKKMQKTLEKERSEFSQRLQKLEADLKAKMKQSEIDFRKKYQSMQEAKASEAEKAKSLLKAKLEENITKARAQHDIAMNEMRKKLSDAEREIKVASERFVKLNEEYKNNINENKIEFERKLELAKDSEVSRRISMEKQFQVTILNMKNETEAKISAMENEHNLSTENLKRDSERDKKDLIEKAEQTLQKEKSLLEKEHSDQLKTLQDTLNTEHKSKLEETKAMNEREKAHMMENIKKANDEAIRGLKNEHEKLNDSLSETIRNISAEKENLENQNLESNRIILSLKNEIREKVENHKRETNQMEFEKQKALEEISIKNKIDLENEINRHRNEEERLCEDIKAANLEKEELQEQMRMAKLEWEIKYRDRESRPEDLKQIASLQRKMIKCEKKVKQTIEEMRYFKMELENREESYNKVFGRQPNVGFLQTNPVANMQKKTSGVQNRKKSKEKTLPPLSHSQKKLGPGTGTDEVILKTNNNQQSGLGNQNNIPLRPNSDTRRASRRASQIY